MKKQCNLLLFFFLFLNGCQTGTGGSFLSDGPRRVEILFLGHDSQHHDSEKLMPMLAMPLFQKGINLTYTADPDDLNEETLNKYDGIMIYAPFESFGTIQSYLEENKIEILSSGFERIPQVTKKLTEEEAADVEKLLEKIEEDDDVQNVYHTMEESSEE